MGMSVNKLAVILVDVVLILASYYLGFVFRYEGFPPEAASFFKSTAGWVVLSQLAVFNLTGLHKGPWRFTGILDLANVVRASLAGLVVSFAGVVFLFGDGQPVPSRAAFALMSVNVVALAGGFRLLIRVAYSKQLRRSVAQRFFGERFMRNGRRGEKRALIYGANERGEMLLRSLLSAQESSNYTVAGFIDDDPNKRGVVIHGVKQMGTSRELDGLIGSLDISEVIVASDPGKETMKRIFETCRVLKVPCRVVPPYLDVVHQRIGISQARKLEIDDLLRRETVKIDYSRVEGMLHNKRVLVTGGAGSIGRQLCLQILEFEPGELICVDTDENQLFFLQQTVAQRGLASPCFYHCCSVTDRAKMASVFGRHRPDVVFHAAAHKHVPMMEMNVDSALLNNVGGTKNVADLADEYGAGTFVFISTDKAVEPGNAMGWSKRMGEVYVRNLALRSRTKYLAVRFGNVLGSNGSVVPIFQQQIAAGGPVRVTHPEMTRYFMTIPEAVLLILQSVLLGESGSIMILEMGEPVKIVELAEEMIRMAGYTPGQEVEIVFTGLRPGEKLHEELLYDSEQVNVTAHPKVRMILPPAQAGEDLRPWVDGLMARCRLDATSAYGEMQKKLADYA